ncbi:hypothetical protein ABT336_14425 [Micromonospora sp. NPDC000207]|uniref:hypothetical protein n=1 Tax=Micromonospora sp. NPDC000207 TaxID=3154246 RepID=UPI0033204C8D
MTGRKPEDALQRQVLEMCKLLHLHTAHFRPALTRTGRWITPVGGDGKGWPDLTIVGPGGILFRELKSATGSRTPEQRQWAGWLAEAGADVAVWKPRDMESGRIKAELEAIRRPVSRLLSEVAGA